MWRVTRIALSAWMALLLSTCSSDDGTTDPDDDTDGETVTLLSGDVAEDWEMQHAGNAASSDDYVAGVLRARAELVWNGAACVPIGEAVTATSLERVDFTACVSARATFRVTGRVRDPDHFSYTNVRMWVRSNVPGTPDLSIAFIPISANDDTFDQSFDLSLENALGFEEATVELELRSSLYEYDGGCNREAWVEARDFGVMGEW